MQSQAENWKLCPVICTPNFCIPNSVSCCPQKHTPGDASHLISTPSGSYKPFGVTSWANRKQHMKCFCAFQREQCLQRALKESSAQWKEMQSDHPGLADNTLHSSPDVNLYLHPVSRYFTRVKLPPDTQRAQAEGEWCQWEENWLWSHFFPLLPCLISLATRQPLSRLSFTWETRLQSQCRGRLPSASMTSEMKDLCRCEIGHTVKQKNVFLPGLITGNCLIQRSKPALAK